MGTTFEERAEALAIAGGFGWPVTEDQLAFDRIEFLDRTGNVVAVSEGDKTRNSRMFFEHTLGEHCLIIASDPCDTPGIACFWYAPDKALAEDFFGPERYNDPELGPDHHASVYGGKTAVRLRLYRKEGGLMISLKRIIERGWEVLDTISPESDGALPEAVDIVLEHLDAGALRVAEPDGAGGWIVNQWLKKTVLLSFRLNANAVMDFGSAGAPSFDKVSLKFSGWDEDRFLAAGIRAVPGSIVRRGAHVGRNVVLMPSFVNIGANIGDGTMIDTWASVGSCAQVGKNCHISAGAGIGGVLEPMQANPTIIGDNCFIGARSEIVEGVIVGEGCVVAMGVFITATSKIVYRDTGEIITGHIPPYSVVVPGTLPGKLLPDGSPGPSLSCAVIIKTVDEQTRSKTATNDLLRD